MPPRIWNTRRQLLGNLVPLLMGIIAGLLFFRFNTLVCLLVGICAAALGVNFWGFFENAKINRELRNLTRSGGELIGFVYKEPPTLLDAHAEIGLLSVQGDHIDVVSERGGVVIRRDDVASITRRANIHSILFLGGWIVLSLNNGTEFKFESRKHNTMLASRIRSAQLYLELALWKSQKGPA